MCGIHCTYIYGEDEVRGKRRKIPGKGELKGNMDMGSRKKGKRKMSSSILGRPTVAGKTEAYNRLPKQLPEVLLNPQRVIQVAV